MNDRDRQSKSGEPAPEGPLGLRDGRVRLAPFSDEWARFFAAESARLAGALGGDICAGVEHIGSTAVAGMTAKPLVDIMVGVHDIGRRESCIGPLESIGYSYKGEFGLPGREFYVLGAPATAHVHLVQHGGHFWRLNALFRDYLRSNEAARQRYLDVKRDLAERFADDRPSYTAGKNDIITELLAEAGWDDEAERARG